MSEETWIIVSSLVGIFSLFVLFTYAVYKEHNSTDKDMI